ncbi:MAG: Gfo/Idh/MocA family oxidoreductase [Anaerolineales bacterium]
MTHSPLHWGLLSTARINRSLIPALRGSRRNLLVAVASRSQETADAYAKEWGIPRALGSYEALIEDPDIQVIYNPLPNSLHAEWTIKALHAGKHVLCEKPLALSVTEIDEMSAVAQASGCVLAEAFMYRHHPQTLKVQELISGGALGKLRLIRGSFTFTLTREGNYRSKKEMGGGSLWDVGCYPINYARTLVGAEPLEVFGWQVTGPGGCDETFVGQMRFPGDVLAQFDSGFRSPFRVEMEVVGAEATLRIPNPFKPGHRETLLLQRGNRLTKIRVGSRGALYAGEVEDLADAILLGRAPRISLADSRGNVAAITALLASAQQGKSVQL